MSGTAIVLVLISAFMHAGWNLLARARKSELAFFTRMLIMIAAVGFLPVLVSEIITRSLPLRAWFCLAGSGLCAGVYLYSLAMAYGLSDFTIVYPVARAMPVLLVGLTDVLRGRFLTGGGWMGLAFVAVGCFLTPLHSFREFSIRRYFHRSILWMILAALGTVGYSTFDKIASEVVLKGPGTAVRYGYVFFSFSTIVLLVLQCLGGRKSWKDTTIGWKLPIIGMVCFFGSYCLILWAYQLGRYAGYVVAFRQFSIIIGVATAVLVYKERGVVVRLVGVVLITLGLVIVGMLGN